MKKTINDILAITAGNTNVRLCEVAIGGGIRYENTIEGEVRTLYTRCENLIRKQAVVFERIAVEDSNSVPTLVIKYARKGE